MRRTFCNVAIAPVAVISFVVMLIIQGGLLTCKGDKYDICTVINDIFLYYSPHVEDSEFDRTEYGWRKNLRDNYKTIKEEYLEYTRIFNLPRLSYVDPDQHKLDSNDLFEIPWSVLFLEIYGRQTDKYRYFPRTKALLSNQNGLTVITAMLSVLQGGRSTPAHRGFYYGVTRYHLALSTTRNPNNCVLIIHSHSKKKKKKKYYHWKEGHDVIFDDTYLHEVHNHSKNETRVILFLDVQKEFNHIIPNTINNILLFLAKYHYRVVETVKRQNEFQSMKVL